MTVPRGCAGVFAVAVAIVSCGACGGDPADVQPAVLGLMERLKPDGGKIAAFSGVGSSPIGRTSQSTNVAQRAVAVGEGPIGSRGNAEGADARAAIRPPCTVAEEVRPLRRYRIAAVYRFLLVCLGGAVGTGARYLIALEAPRVLGATFPYGTLVVNVVGSFLLGAIMHVGLTTNVMSPDLRLMLTTGIMGGFTTYSTFNYETMAYLRQGAFWLAGLNMAATLLLCLLAGALGLALARWLVGG
jgi:fluoride exporter